MKALGKVLGNIFRTLLALDSKASLGFYGILESKRLGILFAWIDFILMENILHDA
jgi:hypothetical protein